MTAGFLKAYPPASIVQKAYELAETAHRSETRKSGDPYIVHPLRVAQTVHDWHLDEASIAAALLHDVLENNRSYSLKDISKQFGEEVAFLVQGLTKFKNLPHTSREEDAENMRRFILSFSKDLRIVLIKLADRLHNMQTLQFLPAEQQRTIAKETMDIFAPLAYRLGMQRLSGDLEDLAFPYVYPSEYQWLLREVKDSYTDRFAYTKRLIPIVRKLLKKHGVRPIALDARAKRYSSLYKKLIRYDMDLGRIYDLVAVRIIVGSVSECYRTLGVIHEAWQPLPGRIKDYIARPKPNGYRSLHTTVFCLNHTITEFQIRTQEMHEEGEHGIAAHWAYQQARNEKNTKAWTGVRNGKELLWVSQLRNWQEHFTNQQEFLDSLKVDFFKDRIFVLTPGNDVIDLPAGSTPVDFAYRIHSDIGDQCVGAKINGKITPLDYELRSGDVVEILTQRGTKPSEGWLRFAKSSLAKKQIRSALNPREKEDRMRQKPEHMEFRIVHSNRPGYFKDIAGVFHEMKINLSELHNQPDQKLGFAIATARSEKLSKQKMGQLLVRLKKLPGTKEIGRKVVR